MNIFHRVLVHFIPGLSVADVTVGVPFVQARRIDCEHCGQPFSFLNFGSVAASAEDLHVFGSPTASTRQFATRVISKLTAAMAAKRDEPNAGTAACPHCNHLQAWMRQARRRQFWATTLVASAVAAGIAAIGTLVVTQVLLHMKSEASAAAAVAFTYAAFAFGGVFGLGWLSGVALQSSTDRIGELDRHAKTDAQIEAWLAAGKNPAKKWLFELLGKRPRPKGYLFVLEPLDTAAANELSEDPRWDASTETDFAKAVRMGSRE